MVTRNFAIRLSLQESETVKRGLLALGKDGQAAMASIERGSRPASAGLLAVNNAGRQVQGGMQALAGRTGVLGGALSALGPAGLAAAAGIGGLVVATRAALQRSEEALDTATQLADTADKLGIGIAALQEYRFAAEQAGVAQGTFDLALQRFTRRAAEAVRGQGEAKDALKELGIQLTDTNGRMRPTEDLLSDVADAFAKVDGQAARLRLGFKLFDSEGVALVNVLQQGSAALEQMRQRARDAGVVLDEKMVLSARETKNELDLMRKVIQTQLDSAFLTLAPTLVDSAKLFAEIATAVADVVDGFRDIEDMSTRGLQSRLLQIESDLPALRQRAQGAPDELLAGDIGVGIDTRQSVEGEIEQLERRADLIRQQLDLRRQEAEARKQANEAVPGGSARAEADAIDELIAKMREEIEILSFSKDLREEETAVRKARALAMEKEIEFDERDEALVRALVRQKQELVKAETDEVEAQRTANRLREEARQLMAGVRTEGEKLADLQVRLNELVAAGALTQEDANKVMERSRKSTDALTKAQERLADVFENVLDEAIAGNIKSWEDLGRVAVRALQDILREILRTQQSASGGLFGGVGGSGGGAFGGIGSIIINGLSSLFGSGSPPGGSLTFGGPRAHGGPVEPGRVYLVGERRPELFAPTVPGQIVPLPTPAARGGVQVTIVNNVGAEVGVRESESPGGGVSLEITLDDAVARQVRRPGSNTSRALIDVFGAQRALAAR